MRNDEMRKANVAAIRQIVTNDITQSTNLPRQ